MQLHRASNLATASADSTRWMDQEFLVRLARWVHPVWVGPNGHLRSQGTSRPRPPPLYFSSAIVPIRVWVPERVVPDEVGGCARSASRGTLR